MTSLTKIIATVGPACEKSEMLKKLIEAGVSIFRLNLKHNDISWHRKIIQNIDTLRKKHGYEVGVMLDLQGPELRLLTKNMVEIEVFRGEEIYLGDVYLADRKSIILSKKDITNKIKLGEKIYIDSGLYEFKVVFSKKGLVVLKSIQDCVIKNGKSVAIPGFENDLPALTRGDFSNLSEFCRLPIDFVCLSFCRSKEDVKKLRQVLKLKNMKVSVVSKIESRTGLNNLDEIIDTSDGVMVARGDLGVEVPIKEIAFWQKEIIRSCRLKNKPVIVATQMMESMVEMAKPTRAEVSDVANAVFDGADCLMLSGETAVGKYPIGVVTYMQSICQFTEYKRSIDRLKRKQLKVGDLMVNSVRNLVVNSKNVSIDKILVFSKSGNTARFISSYRLGIPMVSVTDSKKTIKDMLLSYAIIPYYKKFGSSKFDASGEIIDELMKIGLLKKGERVIVVHGQSWLVSSTTNEVGVFEV